jgi:NAD(P)-dependent dehydrogenase (short-subunit alcohol dehydrogenase family)
MAQSETTWSREAVLSRFTLEGKVALVTGGDVGIGEAITMAFASVGANVGIAALDLARAERTAAATRQFGGRALAIAADVTDGAAVEHLIEAMVREFGGIDVLVNNVGGFTRRVPPFELDRALWYEVIDRNLTSAFLASKAAGRVMKERGGGNIVNMASAACDRPYPENLAYDAAKAGIVSITGSLAVYFAPYNIRVNAIAPGRIAASPQAFAAGDERAGKLGIPLARLGRVEDVALAAVYLASPASAYVTGTVLQVQGGPHFGGTILEQAAEAWEADRKG